MVTSRSKVLPPLDTNQRYSVDETAAYLRISRAQLYVDIKAGRIPVIKHGKRTLVPGAAIASLSSIDAATVEI